MQCHYEIYETYIQTGMGKSLRLALKENSSSLLDESSYLTDTFLNFKYHPFWESDSLFLKESYKGKSRTEHVDYIIGSGHHTNSHLWEENGYVHQMPFTFYTQDSTLDFPPGFENNHNSRFSRSIGLECMSCHNAMPEFVLGSENKYTKIPEGIDCERCHGPGEVHVHRMRNGELVDTSQYIDYSIVNPAKLSVDKQFQICMRCHLQGNTVLNEGKSFFDFKPGMELSDVMSVFVPRYEDDETFIMASHVDRFKQSACFEGSDMTCITCHNPHHSVQKQEPNFFNDKCLSCHDDCSSTSRKTDNCVSCHMPNSETIDIPHVSIHDHKISIPDSTSTTGTKGDFIGLVSINNSNPSDKMLMSAYMYQYEKFDAKPYLLDSAEVYLNKIKVSSSYSERIHFYYLKEDYRSIINVVNVIPDLLSKLDKESYSNNDAWTAYRVGQAYLNIDKKYHAITYLEKANKLAPFMLKFRLKLADTYNILGKLDLAEQEYRKLIAEYPKDESSWCNLGFLLHQKKNYLEADKCYEEALSLNPQHLQTLFNKVSLEYQKRNTESCVLYLNQILEIQPDNQKAKLLLDQVL